MHFAAFADYARRLEETSSRTELVAILAELFAMTPPDEIAPATYLLQGRVAPAFVPLELGMGLVLVAQAIAHAYGMDPAAVRERFDRVGDLGTVAGQLAAEAGTAVPAEDTPALHTVFARLRAIAEASGPGSATRKVSLLVDVLAALDPASAGFACRIPLGTLRLGIGDPTVLDAYSVATAGDRSLRPRLERAYNETSDLGLIGTTLWERGIDAVDALGIRVGNPVRPALAERLPSAEAILARLGPCAVENKYDGFRCQVHKDGETVHVFSRSLEDMTDAFPEIARGVAAQIVTSTAIIEGEALAYHPLSEEYLPFQQTMRRRRKHGVAEAAAALPLRLFTFDVLYADGERVTERPYAERHALLGQLVHLGDTIVVAETRGVETPAELMTVFDAAIGAGLEGIVAKKLDAP